MAGDVQVGNEQLRQALRNAGIEVDDLAVKAEVDVKTVRRWLTGRTPRQRYRRRVADALGVSEQVLWPGVAPDQDEQDEPGGETVEVLAAAEAPDWRELLADTHERVELLDLTLGDVITDGDEDLLAAAAGRGCRVRVLVSDRDSVHLAIAEQDAGREVSLTSRPASTGELDRVVALLAPHVQAGDLELRMFVGAGPYRILILDDQALVRLRLPGVEPDAMPVLYLTRERSDGILDGFTRHFETVWQTSEPLS
jgi:lambda repressor-like predicted transcriptional regulator